MAPSRYSLPSRGWQYFAVFAAILVGAYAGWRYFATTKTADAAIESTTTGRRAADAAPILAAVDSPAQGPSREPVAAAGHRSRTEAPARLHPAPDTAGSDGDHTPIGSLAWRQRATIEGTVRQVRVAALSGAPSLQVDVWDGSGGITLVFYGRRRIAGIDPGRCVRASGMVGELHGTLAISNPLYELVEARTTV